MIVAQRAIHRRLVEDELENLHRVAAETDEPHLARLLNLAQRRDGLIHDLLHLHELDVVAEHDVEMVGAEPVQGHVHALGHAFRAEVKVLEIVATELRAERVAVTRHAAQRDTEQHFADAASVERRGVDEVQPAIERHADALQRVLHRDGAELLPERRRAEAEDGKLKTGFAESACLHRRDSTRPSQTAEAKIAAFRLRRAHLFIVAGERLSRAGQS